MPPVMYGKTKRPIKVKTFDHLENSTLTGKINSGVHYAISEPFLFNNTRLILTIPLIKLPTSMALKFKSLLRLTLHDGGPYHVEASPLQSKSMDWFLYDKDLLHESVKP